MDSYVKHYLKSIDDPLPELRETFEREVSYLTGFVVAGKNSKILDLGCGAGRPLLELATSYPNKDYVGIDNHPDMVKAAKKRLRGSKVEMYQCDIFDPGLSSFVGNVYSLVYSTYNTIGYFPASAQQLMIKQQADALRKGGVLTNITWSRDDETTQFLNKYYPYIGLLLINLTADIAITDHGCFERVPPGRILDMYKNAGIKPKDVVQMRLFTAVTGVKL